MAQLVIRYYPDPILRQRCPPVERFDAALRRLAGDMVETMHTAPGVGLAAPQVGEGLRLAVVDTSVGEDPEALHVLVNPEIVATEGAAIDVEGCLSIPDFTDKVERPERVRVRAQDLDGGPIEIAADGFVARAICHEIDHLDGVLFTDRLRGLRRDRARRFLKRMTRSRHAEAAV